MASQPLGAWCRPASMYYVLREGIYIVSFLEEEGIFSPLAWCRPVGMYYVLRGNISFLEEEALWAAQKFLLLYTAIPQVNTNSPEQSQQPAHRHRDEHQQRKVVDCRQ